MAEEYDCGFKYSTFYCSIEYLSIYNHLMMLLVFLSESKWSASIYVCKV